MLRAGCAWRQWGPGIALIASLRSESHIQGSSLHFCPSVCLWDQGFLSKAFHGSCAGEMFAPGTLSSGLGCSCSWEIMLWIRPKPREFLCRVQVSTNIWMCFIGKKKSKTTANEEDSSWKVKMCSWDFAPAFPTKQAGSVAHHLDKRKQC